MRQPRRHAFLASHRLAGEGGDKPIDHPCNPYGRDQPRINAAHRAGTLAHSHADGNVRRATLKFADPHASTSVAVSPQADSPQRHQGTKSKIFVPSCLCGESACGLTHRAGSASVTETVSRRQDCYPGWHCEEWKSVSSQHKNSVVRASLVMTGPARPSPGQSAARQIVQVGPAMAMEARPEDTLLGGATAMALRSGYRACSKLKAWRRHSPGLPLRR